MRLTKNNFKLKIDKRKEKKAFSHFIKGRRILLYFTSCIKFTTVSFANVVGATPAVPPLAVTTTCTLISISISINGQKVVGQKSFALLIRNPIRRLSLFKFYLCKAEWGEREGC